MAQDEVVSPLHRWILTISRPLGCVWLAAALTLCVSAWFPYWSLETWVTLNNDETAQWTTFFYAVQFPGEFRKSFSIVSRSEDPEVLSQIKQIKENATPSEEFVFPYLEEGFYLALVAFLVNALGHFKRVDPQKLVLAQLLAVSGSTLISSPVVTQLLLRQNPFTLGVGAYLLFCGGLTGILLVILTSYTRYPDRLVIHYFSSIPGRLRTHLSAHRTTIWGCIFFALALLPSFGLFRTTIDWDQIPFAPVPSKIGSDRLSDLLYIANAAPSGYILSGSARILAAIAALLSGAIFVLSVSRNRLSSMRLLSIAVLLLSLFLLAVIQLIGNQAVLIYEAHATLAFYLVNASFAAAILMAVCELADSKKQTVNQSAPNSEAGSAFE